MAKILIVEDHALSRQMLVTLLGSIGHQLFEAGDGLTALSIAQKEEPDLIICDIVMPGMDGVEFVRRLQQETALPKIPVIFYTALYRLPEIIQQDELNGNCRVIPKPSDPSFIIQTVEEVLGVPSQKTVPLPATGHLLYASSSNYFHDAGLKLAMIMELSLSMVMVRNPVNLLSTFCRAVREILNCTHSLLTLQDEKGKSYFYRGDGNDPSLFCPVELLPPANVIRQVMEKGVPVRWRQNTGQALAIGLQGRESCTSWMLVPLASPSRTYGWLCLSDKLAGLVFTAEEEEMVMALSKQVALAYENILLAEELRQSEKQLHLTLATTGIQSWSWEVGSEVVTWLNPDGQEVYQSQPMVEYIEKIHPADRRMVREKLEQAMANGQNFEVEFRIRQENRERWLLAKGFVCKENDQVVKLMGINVDITERKRMEEENLASERELLRVTLNSLTEGVVATDNKGRMIFFNEAASRLTGYTEAEALGRPVQEILYLLNDRTSEPITMIEPGVSYKNHILVNRNLREIPVFVESSPIKLQNGKRIGTVTVLLDISEQRQAERELLKTEKLESLGVLAAGIAHDFNNILTAIISNIQLAAFYFDRNEDIRPSLREIVEIAHKATGLTKQLLTFAKGGAPIKKDATLIGLIKDTTEFVLSGSKIKAHYQIAEHLWAVSIDEGQISQVIHNLVINAKQAMPNGGIIEIIAENVEIPPGGKLKPGKYVKVTIKDHGIGISSDIIDKIFDPFFTTKETGNGLGLATAFSIIRQHDGEIEVESQVGVGSSFMIYLPATTTVAPQEETVRETATTCADARILLMDDEFNIRNAVGSLLQSYGYEIVLAGDGQETIETFTRARQEGRPFDVVVLDLTIPGGMGGLEVIDHLRRINPEIKAIVSSGYADDPIMAEYKKYGFSGVVSKPYKIDELLEVLQHVLCRVGA